MEREIRVTSDTNPLWPVQWRWYYYRAEVIQEWDLVWFHLVQAGTANVQNVSSPAIDLAGSCAPEDLVKHNIRLKTQRSLVYVQGEVLSTHHIVIASAHLYHSVNQKL